ncbi:hypothetical protein [Xanthomonas populi]|nr:hypothetical protein [Xanthomonas populi]
MTLSPLWQGGTALRLPLAAECLRLLREHAEPPLLRDERSADAPRQEPQP